MSGFEPLKVEIDDTGIKKLLEIGRRTGKLLPAFKKMGETVRTSVIKNFEVGGRYSEPGSAKGGNEKWKELSVASLYAGKNKYGQGGVLKKSGGYQKGMSPEEIRKRRKILIKSGQLSDDIVVRASDGGIVVGSDKKYAAIQNFGGKAGRGKKVTIPARPFLVVQDEDWREIGEELEDFLLKGV